MSLPQTLFAAFGQLPFAVQLSDESRHSPPWIGHRQSAWGVPIAVAGGADVFRGLGSGPR